MKNRKWIAICFAVSLALGMSGCEWDDTPFTSLYELDSSGNPIEIYNGPKCSEYVVGTTVSGVDIKTDKCKINQYCADEDGEKSFDNVGTCLDAGEACPDSIDGSYAAADPNHLNDNNFGYCLPGATCIEGRCEACAAGQILCGGECVNPRIDSSWCGAKGDCIGENAGKKCPKGNACVEGECSVACLDGQELCGDACVVLSSDPNNCGECGNKCPSGNACVEGECSADCLEGQELCGNACVILSSDPNNCGECGIKCPSGKACVEGECSASCLEGQELCGNACVVLASDPNNCGECGIKCPSGKACVEGECSASCLEGQELCGNTCVVLASDPINCGKCDNKCPKGNACVDGKCSADCLEGQELCGNACVILATDPSNCGTCNNKCPKGNACVDGKCSADCLEGQDLCGNACVILSSDPNNCGTCNNKCPKGNACVNGKCSADCLEGQELCGNACVILASDPNNCGKCGNKCPQGNACTNGICSASCLEGQVLCGNKCIDPMTDTTYCGANTKGNCTSSKESDNNFKGIKCESGMTCQNGLCTVKCLSTQALCGGKCIDPKTDSNFCGATGKIDTCGNYKQCTGGQTCNNGECKCPGNQILCKTGEGSLCVDPSSSNDNCGCNANSAGEKCKSGMVCSGGTCGTKCLDTQALCDSKCIDPQTDSNFCGATGRTDSCGNSTKCDGGQICKSGSCTCAITGQAFCDSQCIDSSVSNTHCGAKGKCNVANKPNDSNYAGVECTGGQVCQSGTCQCPSNLVLCNGNCIDPKSNSDFCGATTCKDNNTSGSKCGSGAACVNGTCTTTNCSNTQCFYNGSCVNQNDHCGSNCINCNTNNNASAGTCSNSGACSITTCAVGYHKKNNTECEANSATKCGARNSTTTVNCKTTGNAVDGYCNDGSCVIKKCAENYNLSGANLTCKLNTTEACGAQDSTKTENCNTANNAEVGTCDKGVCKVTKCAIGFHMVEDANHVKSCVVNTNSACGSRETVQFSNCTQEDKICSDGTCISPTQVAECAVDQISCNSVCIKPLTDLTYCGASGACTDSGNGNSVGQNCAQIPFVDTTKVTCLNGECYIIDCNQAQNAYFCNANSHDACCKTIKSWTFTTQDSINASGISYAGGLGTSYDNGEKTLKTSKWSNTLDETKYVEFAIGDISSYSKAYLSITYKKGDNNLNHAYIGFYKNDSKMSNTTVEVTSSFQTVDSISIPVSSFENLKIRISAYGDAGTSTFRIKEIKVYGY